MTQELSPPKHIEIARYWQEKPEFSRAFDNAPACFACCDGRKCWTHLERAHIVARCQGGSYAAGNYVLLCRTCHREQPMLADRDLVIDWVRAHAHFAEFIVDLMKREMSFYGPDFRWDEIDRIRCLRFLRRNMLSFHPEGSIQQKFDAAAKAIRAYVKARDLHEKVFLQ